MSKLMFLENQQERIQRYQRYENALADLKQEGNYVFSVADELANCKRMNDADFENHLDRIRKKYQTQQNVDEHLMAVHAPKIMKYMKANNLSGENAFVEAAKALKYVR